MEPTAHHRTKNPKSKSRTRGPTLKPTTRGNFYKARDFTIRDSSFYDISLRLETFMKEFAEKTIPGAAFDSSERDPPPRCHPGTRLAIVERTLRFFADRNHNKSLVWLVGPAGVGKSAIMQTLAEVPSTPDITLGASLFFSVNGRDNGSKAVVTLAYQMAVRSQLYRDFVQSELSIDPTLLDKALASQFNKLIFEPFITHRICPAGDQRFLIIIDGLDECNNQGTQCMILDLISTFCIKYPTAPLVWVIASRPEPHISQFLARPNVVSGYVKEEIRVDSDESREDAERYLREALESVRIKYPALSILPRWPAERDFLKLATTTNGLFAYGSAVIAYIDDPIYANPIAQLQDVLEVIDETRSQVADGKRHPMADLDALYSRILSKIPRNTLYDTKKLLLQRLDPLPFMEQSNLRFYCNWLGITMAAAYSAFHHLHSVLDIPSIPDAAFDTQEFRHNSFRDYFIDFGRSGMFPNFKDEAAALNVQCVLRILNDTAKAHETGRDTAASISLSWPPPADLIHSEYCQLYLSLYRFMTNQLAKSQNLDLCCNPGLVQALKLIHIQAGIELGGATYLYILIPSFIFGSYLRPKLEELHAFQEMPISMFDGDKIDANMMLIVYYHSKNPLPVALKGLCALDHSHENVGGMSNSSDEHCWKYCYWAPGGESGCDCSNNVLQPLAGRKAHSPSDILTTFIDITGRRGWVHHTFPDSEDALSTWEYVIPYHF